MTKAQFEVIRAIMLGGSPCVPARAEHGPIDCSRTLSQDVQPCSNTLMLPQAEQSMLAPSYLRGQNSP